MKSLKKYFEGAKRLYRVLNEDLKENYHKSFEDMGLTMTGNILQHTSPFGLGGLIYSVVSGDLEFLKWYLTIILTINSIGIGADVLYKISNMYVLR